MPRQPIKQERAYETRARIIAGSASSFAENGYSGSTIADILKRSGVTKGTLYFHFETKEDVARAVLEAHSAWLDAASATVQGGSLQGVIDLTYLFCDAFASDDVLRAAARLSVDKETFGLSQEPAFLRWERLCEQALLEARQDNALVADVDVDAVARVAMTMLLGSHLAALGIDGGRSRIHVEMERFWRIALPGIASSAALGLVDVDGGHRGAADVAAGTLQATS